MSSRTKASGFNKLHWEAQIWLISREVLTLLERPTYAFRHINTTRVSLFKDSFRKLMLSKMRGEAGQHIKLFIRVTIKDGRLQCTEILLQTLKLQADSALIM